MNSSIEHLLDGSYNACLPWKDNHPALPTNFLTCVHRTRPLACKLAKTPHLLFKYNRILTNQEHPGFIKWVYPPADHTKGHHISHYAIRKDSLTTSICIFYDCSCHQSRDQPSLTQWWSTVEWSLLHHLQFRCHPIGSCTDIEKAFFHIWLHEGDRDWSRFLFLTNPLDAEVRFKLI